MPTRILDQREQQQRNQRWQRRKKSTAIKNVGAICNNDTKPQFIGKKDKNAPTEQKQTRFPRFLFVIKVGKRDSRTQQRRSSQNQIFPCAIEDTHKTVATSSRNDAYLTIKTTGKKGLPSTATSKKKYATTTTTTTTKKVTFSCCEIREYISVVGDSPSCKIGLPIALGWDHTEQVSHPIDRYEMLRSAFRAKCCRDLYLDKHERVERLVLVGGYSLGKLARLETKMKLQPSNNSVVGRDDWW